MLNLKGLQIGNLFFHADKIIIVDGIDNSNECILVKDKHISIPSNECNAPITPELLQRYGFKVPAGNGWGYRMDVNSVDELCWYKQDGFLRYQTKGEGFTRSLEHIKYFHQLQNLYFSLTG